MGFLNNFDQDSILWFIILFLLLFWCGKGCENDCGCENECFECHHGHNNFPGGCNQGC